MYLKTALSTSPIIIFLIFTSLLIGVVITFSLSRLAPSVPFTVCVFVAAFITAVFSKRISSGLGDAFLQWNEINSDLIIATFVPPLIFGEVINLNIHHVGNTILQSSIQAGPGAVIFMLTMGAAIDGDWILPFPTEWKTSVCYLFSAIICATDPVAVVALMNKTKGIPSRLKYVISQESILNDAAALALYNYFIARIGGEDNNDDKDLKNTRGVAVYFLQVVLVSPCLGMLIGTVAVVSTSIANKLYKEEDSIVHVIIPLCCAYLSFLIGEYALDVSGIVTCFFAGLMYSWLAPSVFQQREMLRSLWSSIEWVGNTLVFTIAGMLSGVHILSSITADDMANILVIYLLTNVIRICTTAAFHPVMMSIGKGFSLPESIFLSFSGVRGAISIALALSTQRGSWLLTKVETEQLFVYVSGLSTLTLLVNGTLAGWVLKQLNLSDSNTDSIEGRLMVHYSRKRVALAGIKLLSSLPDDHLEMVKDACSLIRLGLTFTPSDERKEEENLANDTYGYLRKLYILSSPMTPMALVSPPAAIRAQHVHEETVDVGSRIPIEGETLFRRLSFSRARHSYEEPDDDIGDCIGMQGGILRRRLSFARVNDDLMSHVRKAFLEVVRMQYWSFVNTGRMQRGCPAMRYLLASVDVGLETVQTPGLQDWEFLHSRVLCRSRWESTLESLSTALLERVYTYIRQQREETQVSVLMSFIAAHEYAQVRVPALLGEEISADTAEQTLVIEESQAAVRIARERLRAYNPQIVRLHLSKETVQIVLYLKEELVSQLQEEGVLWDGDILFEEVQRDKAAMERAFSAAVRLVFNSSSDGNSSNDVQNFASI